jgi:cell division protein ZipA
VEQLRIILIILGVVLVAGIWLADRIRRRRQKWPPPDWDQIDSYNEDAVSMEDTFPSREEEQNPDEWVGQAFTARRNDVLDDAQLEGLKGLATKEDGPVVEVPGEPDEKAGATTSAKTKPARGEQPEEEFIVLTLLAAEGRQFRGPLLLKALQDCNLAHGDMDIFHYTPAGYDEPLFSVANILEPGRFIMSEMAQMQTPGLALFMRLPGPLAGSDALRQMLHKARELGAQLSATLCNGQRQPLDDAALAQLEKKVQVFSARR